MSREIDLQVHEEVENGLRRYSCRTITRSPSLRIKALEPTNLRLIFNKKLSLPIFTGSKVVAGDSDGQSLQILLVDTSGEGMVPTTLPYPIKVELVVLDGDFPSGQSETNWSREEFDKNIVKERTGKRPLLTGELNFTMRDGVVSVGEIEFTDNSSWIRSRKFRIGAKVVQIGNNQTTVRITEAITESFVVKDHRGECKQTFFFHYIFFWVVKANFLTLQISMTHYSEFYHPEFLKLQKDLNYISSIPY